MSASAHIQPDGSGNWMILDNGEIRTTYPSHAIHLSVLWKAAVRDRELSSEILTLDRIRAILTADLRLQNVGFQVPADPLADTGWILLRQRTYADATDSVINNRFIQGPAFSAFVPTTCGLLVTVRLCGNRSQGWRRDGDSPYKDAVERASIVACGKAQWSPSMSR
jgi:hypothetical protein